MGGVHCATLTQVIAEGGPCSYDPASIGWLKQIPERGMYMRHGLLPHVVAFTFCRLIEIETLRLRT